MTRRRRVVLSIVFVFFMMVCGLVAGTYVGGRFFVPPGSGLAGPAIALGYGIIGVGVAAVIGSVLAYVLPPKWFLGAALPVTIVGVVLLIVIVNAYLVAEERKQAHLDEAYKKLNKFRVTLVHVKEDDAPFKRMEADWGERRYTAAPNEADARTCTAALSGAEAVALLGALREVEAIVLKDAFPCAGTLGEVERQLDWFIPEATPPDSQGKHAITTACLEQYPALQTPFEAAADIFLNGDHAKECGS